MKRIKNIIVEGADQSGKSLFVGHLAHNLGWSVRHYGPPPKGFDFFDDYLPDDGENMISDRNYLSELAYSKVNYKKHRIKNLDSLENKFKDLSTIIIVLVSTRKLETRDEKYSKKEIRRVRKIYGEIYHKIKLEKYYLNLDDEKDLLIIEKIIKRCK